MNQAAVCTQVSSLQDLLGSTNYSGKSRESERTVILCMKYFILSCTNKTISLDIYEEQQSIV